MRISTAKLVGLAVICLPVSAAGADMSYLVRAKIPVHCQVQQRSPGGEAVDGSAVSLGSFREYCNAPGGYQLVVRYAPGSLQGAVLQAGEDHVILNGSGEAILSRASGPRFRERAITATPGRHGFDTDRLEFQLLPS